MSEWQTAYYDHERTVPSIRFAACVECQAWDVAPLTGWDCPNCQAAEREQRRKAWGAHEVRYTQLRSVRPGVYPANTTNEGTPAQD